MVILVGNNFIRFHTEIQEYFSNIDGLSQR